MGRRSWLIVAALIAAAGLGWALWPDDPAPTSRDRVARRPGREARPEGRTRVWRPPMTGSPCRVEGTVTGGEAAQVVLHSVQGQIDLPGELEDGGARFVAELPEQGRVLAFVTARDGRSARAVGECDGTGRLALQVDLPERVDEGPALFGACVYLETGAPVAEARVSGMWGRSSRAAFTALTDDEGRFRVSVIPGRYRVICAKDGDESPARDVRLDGALGARVELFVAARAAVAGLVRDAQGPLPGVRVRARPARSGGPRTRRSAVSDAEGRFVVHGLPPGPVLVEAQHEGAFAEASAVAQVELPYAEVTLSLSPSAVRVEGIVTAQGAPVVGARVLVAPAADGRGRRGPRGPRRVARTDEAGRYVVGGLAEGKARVRALAEGYAPSTAEVSLGAGATRVDLTLLEACTTEVRVLPDTPPRAVSVWVRRAGGDGRPVRVAGRTGAPLEIEGASGAATLFVRTLGAEVRTASQAVSLCAEPVVVDLDAAAEGTGRLVVRTEDPSGAPVPRVRVWLDARGGVGRTGADGAATFDGLAPRAYRVGTAQADPASVEVRAGETAEVRFEVTRREGDIAGTVVDPGPVEGAQILASCGDTGRPRDLRLAETVARSDAEGRFAFTPDAGGVCLVRAEHPTRGRSRPAVLRVGGAEATLALEGTGRVRGRAIRAADGAPVPRYTLVVRPSGGAAGVEARQQVVSDPQGRFEVLDLPVGPASFAVDAPDGRGRTEADVASSGASQVEISVFRNGAVTGRVVDAGRPLAGASVRVEGEGRRLGQVVTGPDGRFRLSVPAGTSLTIFASATGFYPRGTTPFDLRADGDTDVGDLELEPRGDEGEKEGGIGIVFGTEANGIRVIGLTEDSPSRDAGVLEGDVIVGIDGVPFGANPIVNWVVTLRGRPGTPVVLEIQRGTQPTFAATVIRRAIGLDKVPSEAP